MFFPMNGSELDVWITLDDDQVKKLERTESKLR
jgi:hypothetical protein